MATPDKKEMEPLSDIDMLRVLCYAAFRLSADTHISICELSQFKSEALEPCLRELTRKSEVLAKVADDLSSVLEQLPDETTEEPVMCDAMERMAAILIERLKPRCE